MLKESRRSIVCLCVGIINKNADLKFPARNSLPHYLLGTWCHHVPFVRYSSGDDGYECERIIEFQPSHGRPTLYDYHFKYSCHCARFGFYSKMSS
jgi:hypothetical protein